MLTAITSTSLSSSRLIPCSSSPAPGGPAAPAEGAAGPEGDPLHLREVERRHVLHVLQQEKGNKVHAARALGISRRALYRLITKYHLEDSGARSGRRVHRKPPREGGASRMEQRARLHSLDPWPSPRVHASPAAG